MSDCKAVFVHVTAALGGCIAEVPKVARRPLHHGVPNLKSGLFQKSPPASAVCRREWKNADLPHFADGKSPHEWFPRNGKGSHSANGLFIELNGFCLVQKDGKRTIFLDDTGGESRGLRPVKDGVRGHDDGASGESRSHEFRM